MIKKQRKDLQRQRRQISTKRQILSQRQRLNLIDILHLCQYRRSRLPKKTQRNSIEIKILSQPGISRSFNGLSTSEILNVEFILISRHGNIPIDGKKLTNFSSKSIFTSNIKSRTVRVILEIGHSCVRSHKKKD